MTSLTFVNSLVSLVTFTKLFAKETQGIARCGEYHHQKYKIIENRFLHHGEIVSVVVKPVLTNYGGDPSHLDVVRSMHSHQP